MVTLCALGTGITGKCIGENDESLNSLHSATPTDRCLARPAHAPTRCLVERSRQRAEQRGEPAFPPVRTSVSRRLRGARVTEPISSAGMSEPISSAGMSVLAFIGFGELASSLAKGFESSGRYELRAYVRRKRHAGSPGAHRGAGAQVRFCARLEDALDEATVVLSTVPAAASLEVAAHCAPLLPPGALYIDLPSASPQAKREAEALVMGAGSRYVDAAVLGTVVTSGHRVPILASGKGADAFCALGEAVGLRVTVIDAPAGHAALVKLLRSVYLKGRDALVVEMMLAAKRYGLEDVVSQSIDLPSERVPFPELAERVLYGLALHAGRRADELAAASECLVSAGIDPAFAKAGAESLRAISDLGLRDALNAERQVSARTVLSLIDDRSAALAGSALQPASHEPDRRRRSDSAGPEGRSPRG